VTINTQHEHGILESLHTTINRVSAFSSSCHTLTPVPTRLALFWTGSSRSSPCIIPIQHRLLTAITLNDAPADGCPLRRAPWAAAASIVPLQQWVDRPNILSSIAFTQPE
jgi:hypothetical protein